VRQLFHALRELLMGIRKFGNDGAGIARSAGDVVRRIVRIDNRQPVVILVSKRRYLVLQYQTRDN
jgi:hypothetical protein